MSKRKKKPLLLYLLCIMLIMLIGGYVAIYHFCYPLKYSDEISNYSKQYNVPPHLVCAVIKSESGFEPSAISYIGASGLMQITKDTFEWAKWRLGDANTTYDDIFDPDVNIKYGTYILSLLLEEFHTPEVAMAAYHAGWGSVKKWLEDSQLSIDGENLNTIPFKDTAWYVPKVMENYDIYIFLYKHKFN